MSCASYFSSSYLSPAPGGVARPDRGPSQTDRWHHAGKGTIKRTCPRRDGDRFSLGCAALRFGVELARVQAQVLGQRLAALLGAGEVVEGRGVDVLRGLDLAQLLGVLLDRLMDAGQHGGVVVELLHNALEIAFHPGQITGELGDVFFRCGLIEALL